MNVALYGGTFDPVHKGHIAVARAAAGKFHLGRVYFIPANIPPHKQKRPLTSYCQRYAMLSLALAEEKKFLPSLLESTELVKSADVRASYSIDTVRRYKQQMPAADHLFFLIGVDAFLEISTWRSPVELLRECEFIVANRPGFSLADVVAALPPELRPPVVDKKCGNRSAGSIRHGGAIIHLLPDVNVPVSATQVREAVHAGRSIKKLVGEPVAEYIRKMKLYRDEQEVASREIVTDVHSMQGCCKHKP